MHYWYIKNNKETTQLSAALININSHTDEKQGFDIFWDFLCCYYICI